MLQVQAVGNALPGLKVMPRKRRKPLAGRQMEQVSSASSASSAPSAPRTIDPLVAQQLVTL